MYSCNICICIYIYIYIMYLYMYIVYIYIYIYMHIYIRIKGSKQIGRETTQAMTRKEDPMVGGFPLSVPPLISSDDDIERER